MLFDFRGSEVEDHLAELLHVLGLQRDGHRQAAVAAGAGEHEGEPLVRDAAGAHEHRPPPAEVGVVDRQSDPAGEAEVGAPERVRAADQRRQVGRQLQVVQRRPAVAAVHPVQRRLDRRRAVRQRPGHPPGLGERRRREDHVAKVAVGQRRLQPLASVRGAVQLGGLLRGEPPRQRRAPPHVRREHRVRAVPRRALAAGQLGPEAAEVGAGQLEDVHGGGRRRRLGGQRLRRLGGQHGGRRLVLDVRVRRRRRVAGADEGAVDERHDGDRDAAAEVRPRVDEVQAGEAVGDVVLHAHAEGDASALEVGHLEQNGAKV